MTISSGIETFTPDLSAAGLLRNNHNRPPKPSKIDQFSRTMIAGKWDLNGEAIKFDTEGNLLDGQNRLMACIAAGVPFTTFVVRGLPARTQESMDGGTPRRTVDLVTLANFANPYILTRAAELIWRHRNGGIDQTATPSAMETLSTIRAEPTLSASVEFCQTIKTSKYFPRFYIAALHFVFAERTDPALAAEFFQRLSDGVGLDTESPIYHLRERVLIERTNFKKPLRQRELFALTIIAFNAWRRGTPMKLLKWAQRGKTAQSFPQIAA